MKMKYKLSAEQYAEIKAAQKRNRDKQIANRKSPESVGTAV